MWENHRRHEWHLGTRVLAIMAASVICVTLPTDVMALNELVIDADGNIGIGTDTPDGSVDIERDGPRMRWTNTGAGGGFWDFTMNPNTGRLTLSDDPTSARVPFKFDPLSDNNLLQVGVVSPDQVNIDGHLVVSGTITPDYVFEPDYKLESIEEHAQLMWQKKHLPAVGQAVVDRSGTHKINLGARSQAMLEELEKAHIYISQLHGIIQDLGARVATLEQGTSE